MVTREKPSERLTGQAEIIRAAIHGDEMAVRKIVAFLSAANPTLCQIMQSAIHNYPDRTIWSHLLACFSYHRWNEHILCARIEQAATARLEESIFELFTQDESEQEKGDKEAVLDDALQTSIKRKRYVAAVFAGCRGRTNVIPILDEMIEEGRPNWTKKAIRALKQLRDEECGMPLVKALALNQGQIHRLAQRALQSLGRLAKPALLDALNHSDSHIRWHAARGLGEIGDARAADILVEGLRDENYVVRWATADVIAQMGAPAVKATLTALTTHPLNEPFRRAAYHALNGICSRKTRNMVQPLLDALHGLAPDIEAPQIAQQILTGLKEAADG